MTKKILVTGIGGNVGQGILRNILSYNYDVKLIGTNTEAVSGGNHLCDRVYKVPFSSSPEYIPAIKKICNEEEVDLIIPSTDYETYYLALNKDKLPTVAASDAKTAYAFLNKYQTWLEFKKRKMPFAETTLPSRYKNDFGQIVVKPIEGRGSRDIYVNPKSLQDFSDEFIIQKLYKGTEITTGFYVTQKRELLGQITFTRKLSHGTTVLCEVTFDFDKAVKELISKIVKHFDVRGACNIQAVVDKKGRIIPFEINCRISGTNSIRSQFGFEDVKYTLEEYLYNRAPKKPKVKKGAAARILMDVIYPNSSLSEIKGKSTKHYIF